jgi:hypothetical protein
VTNEINGGRFGLAPSSIRKMRWPLLFRAGFALRAATFRAGAPRRCSLNRLLGGRWPWLNGYVDNLSVLASIGPPWSLRRHQQSRERSHRANAQTLAGQKRAGVRRTNPQIDMGPGRRPDANRRLYK